jgi:hypothetical protein
MNFRRIMGIVSIVFGALNILDFANPMIPTVGLQAFVVGALFIALGLYLRAPRDGSGRIEWSRLAGLFQASRAGAALGDGRKGKPKAPSDPLLAVQVLRLASERSGRLSIAQTAMELNTPIDSAETALDECVAKGIAYLDVDRSSGLSTYRFPEFDPTPPTEDQ